MGTAWGPALAQGCLAAVVAAAAAAAAVAAAAVDAAGEASHAALQHMGWVSTSAATHQPIYYVSMCRQQLNTRHELPGCGICVRSI